MTNKRFKENPYFPTSTASPLSGIAEYIHFIHKGFLNNYSSEFYKPNDGKKLIINVDIIQDLISLSTPHKGALNVFLYIMLKLPKDSFKVKLPRKVLRQELSIGINGIDSGIKKLIELNVIARTKNLNVREYHINPQMIYNGSEYINKYMSINPNSVKCVFKKVYK